MDWERVFNTYGWPTLILFVLGVFFYKAIWPRITTYLDDIRKKEQAAHDTLITHAKKLEDREESLLKDFKETLDGLKSTLEESARRSQAQVTLLEEVAMAVHEQSERTKRNRS